MPKARKKPVVIDYIQYTGDNKDEISQFADGSFEQTAFDIGIRTLEGFMSMTIGDYIIKGVEGEFYPCKEKIFEQTYDKL